MFKEIVASSLLFAVVAMLPMPAFANDYDGTWKLEFRCSTWTGTRPQYAPVQVRGGKISFDGVPVGSRYKQVHDGMIDAAGKVRLTIVDGADRENPYRFNFTGSVTDGKLVATGSCSARGDRGSAELKGEQLEGGRPTVAALPGSSPQVSQGLTSTPPLEPINCAIDYAPIVSRSAAGAATDERPALRLLSIGVSKYKSSEMNLGLASKDACDVAQVFARQSQSLYRSIEVRSLLNQAAARDAILDQLEWLARETTTRDVAILFAAGHGVNDAGGEYFFLPHDADLERLGRTALSQSEIRRALAAIPGKVFVMFDTCHSGQIMSSRRSLPPDVAKFVQELTSAGTGLSVFTAATGRQFAIENDAWGNGAFTKALTEAMRGLADYNKDGAISMFEVELYVSTRVKELTGGAQAPTMARPAAVRNMPLLLVR